MKKLLIGLAVLAAAAPRQDVLSLDRLAEHIVHSLEPVPDERIVLRFDPDTMPSLEPIVRAALERSGARVDTWKGPAVEDFEKRLESADVYVWLPGASRVTSSEQSAALRRWVDRGGTRRELHFHWSEGTLHADATPAEHTPAVDRMYADALEIDYARLKTRQDAFIALLRSGEVRVTTPGGTDVRFRTGERPFNRQDGDGSRRRVARARVRVDRHIELPAGVIRVAPLEESVNGVIVLPATQQVAVPGAPVENVRFEILNGRVINRPSPLQFREFCLGFNPALAVTPKLRLIPYYGYGDGVVRLSFGDNEELGGQVRGGAVMWKFFPDATVTVGGRTLVANGRIAR